MILDTPPESKEGRVSTMSLYEITSENLVKIAETSFDQIGLRERDDLQRLLKKQIDVIAPDTLVVAEEFGEWEESKRRIDLLGLDKDANLVVIELKRTEDGGHMELQAIRYAAMVSTMTFERVVDVYDRYLKRNGSSENAKEAILDFLDWEEPDEDLFAQDVRFLLVSANFSKELTTAVMWLNDRELDIRCIRVLPYQDNGRTLIDVQQVIPLPEATEYQVQIREKEQKGRKERAERYGLRRRFWEGLLALAEGKTKLHANISPSEHHWIGTSSGMRGLNYNYITRQQEGTVELYIDRGDVATNKKIFDELQLHKDEIEQSFGGPLSWERLDARRASRIAYTVAGGYRDDEAKWPSIHETMIDAMIRLEKALSPFIASLKHSAH
ncbi:MAG: DUF4268 domain-containing protein [Acidobacteriota bacterium]|nr:DUF4268 domain-containing protein [Acidobacteriota bacterium]